MLDNVERIEAYLGGADRSALEQDGRTRDAIERCLERICEAAFRLGDRSVLRGRVPPSGVRAVGKWPAKPESPE